MKLFSVLPLVSLAASNQEVKVETYWKPQVCERAVEKGDFVRYHYSGFLKDGTYFDDSYHRGGTYNTYVGSGWLIPGMDHGLYGMCVREKRLIEIPSHLAYGDEGVDGIPGGSVLLFNVELVDIWNPADTVKTDDVVESEPRCENPVIAGDYVRYHYNGVLPNGKPFHSSHDEGQTYDVYAGQGWLIKGMDTGLMGMCPGDTRKITIPPHLAYGENGDGENIPGHSSIIFYVDLIDKHSRDDQPSVVVLESVQNCTRKTERTDFVRYYGNGSTMDKKIFWENSPEDTWDTYLGYKSLIQGMELGLIGACAGERRLITIPPSFGYGETGSKSGSVPPSAVLLFDVRIVDFHNPNDVPTLALISEEVPPENCVKAEDNTIIQLEYKAYLEDGVVFDEHDSLIIHFKSGTFIHGLHVLIQKMCMNTRYRTKIPPHYAYGETGIEDYVPGSAVLNVEIYVEKSWVVMPHNLVAICPEGAEPTFESCDQDNDETVTTDEFAKCFDICRIQGEPVDEKVEALKMAFEKLNRNADGVLDKEEFSLTFPDFHDEL